MREVTSLKEVSDTNISKHKISNVSSTSKKPRKITAKEGLLKPEIGPFSINYFG